MQKNKKWFLHALLFFGLVLFDQIIKVLIGKFFYSLQSMNSGGAFGVGGWLSYYSLITLIALVPLFLGYFIASEKYKVPFVLIIAGGFSNQIDRVFKGGVIDYIDLKIWPSFNLADSLIFVGVFLVLMRFLRNQKTT